MQALITQSRFLADKADDVSELGDYGTAMALALEALPDQKRGIKRPLCGEGRIDALSRRRWRCASKKRSRWRWNRQTAWCAAERFRPTDGAY